MKARALVAWNLRRLRVIRDVSQERLAFDANIDRSYMSGLERQTENPSIDLLERIAKTLGVSLSEFFVVPQKGAPTPKPLRKGRKTSKPARKKQ